MAKHEVKLKWIAVLLALLVLSSTLATAQEVSNPYGENDPLSQRRAATRHDRVTITIDLETEAKSAASSESTKESTFKWSFTNLFKIDKDRDGDIIATAFPDARKPSLDVDTEREHKGEGETAVNYRTKLTISGEVVDVRPNGHLLVEARRTIRIQNEERTVLFTGRVAPSDLNADSTVDAKKVMNFTVKLLGKGDVSDAVKRGWLAKAFDFFSPF
ncbi:MAG: flagellar basal body L-ring protein FlgH [Planctomycetota bacterium]|jgi:flagellar L-ring protein precursor FlgH